MGADADLKIIKVIERYHFGHISGWCDTGKERLAFEKLDSLLIYDQGIY